MPSKLWIDYNTILLCVSECFGTKTLNPVDIYLHVALDAHYTHRSTGFYGENPPEVPEWFMYAYTVTLSACIIAPSRVTMEWVVRYVEE